MIGEGLLFLGGGHNYENLDIPIGSKVTNLLLRFILVIMFALVSAQLFYLVVKSLAKASSSVPALSLPKTYPITL